MFRKPGIEINSSLVNWLEIEKYSEWFFKVLYEKRIIKIRFM